MDFNQYNLKDLAMLWETSSAETALKEIVVQELRSRIMVNQNFSKEYFFDICKLKGHAVTVSFIPTSNAFRNYGKQVTIHMLLEQDEIAELSKNYSSVPPVNTFGLLKAKALIEDNLTPEQIMRLEKIGFHTSEVLQILHV